jgi:hypothetical protein
VDEPTLIEQALEAVEAEIAAVLEKPVSDILHDGKRMLHETDRHQYRFENAPAALQYVEKVRHKRESGNLILAVADADAQGIVLESTKDLGDTLPDFAIEWENDFVLQRLRNRLEILADDDGATGIWTDVLDTLLHRSWVKTAGGTPPGPHPFLNPAQHEALQKAMECTVSFIWGPPGTGKTATLGHIATAYLAAGKRVLFVSNTNRAVDVGLQSILNALALAKKPHLAPRVTRFGELALQTPELSAIHFEAQMVHKLAAAQQAAESAGAAAKEATVNERVELGRFRCVGTTLARLCTSELLTDMQFDAVIVDEASMVNLPYVLVAATHATAHIVFAGDPMQLPPIAQAEKDPHRSFLETDIYLFASGARQPSDLFSWHDQYPQVTSFFDVQYRLSDHLAEVISTVFYEGRLSTGDREKRRETVGDSRIFVLDASPLDPHLELDTEGSGFRPVNRVHMGLALQVAQRLVMQSGFRPEEIGIITPFRHSARHYWRELRKLGMDAIETGTVHTFQGREKQVIIFDTVMTGERTQTGNKRHYTVRPFDELKNGLSVPRLLNVALSRCKDRLVVVADLDHIHRAYRGRFLQKLMDALVENGNLVRQLPGLS